MAGVTPRVDYLDAHERHWTDAELLFQQGRLPNAGHLYGLSAECALKSLLVRLGFAEAEAGDLPPSTGFRKHVNQLWDKFLTEAQGRGYAHLASHLPQGNPFADWSIEQRYHHRSIFNQSRVDYHRTAASTVRNTLQFALREGYFGA